MSAEHGSTEEYANYHSEDANEVEEPQEKAASPFEGVTAKLASGNESARNLAALLRRLSAEQQTRLDYVLNHNGFVPDRFGLLEDQEMNGLLAQSDELVKALEIPNTPDRIKNVDKVLRRAGI